MVIRFFISFVVNLWIWRLCVGGTAKNCDGSSNCEHPASEDILGDFDKDGIVEANEIIQMKEKLHLLFDPDQSGAIDSAELEALLGDKTKEAITAMYAKLDTDADASISMQEMDVRWEKLGAELTVDEVADWLSYSAELPQYAPLFRQHFISGYSLPLLVESNGIRLAEIGIESVLHRKQLVVLLKRRIAGAGKAPREVEGFECSQETRTPSGHVVHLSWKSDSANPSRFQLQSRQHGESTWNTIYSGNDGTYVDSSESSGGPIVYRICSRNSYGRSKRVYLTCLESDSVCEDDSVSPKRNHRNSFWKYASWIDDIGLVLLAIFLPYRLLVHGQANFVLRLLRKLPPNCPTRVVVERVVGEGAVMISWVHPIANGVDIISYTIHCTNVRTGEKRIIIHSTLPLSTRSRIADLIHGDTYRFIVVATNRFNLTADSSQSVYMIPTISPKSKIGFSNAVIAKSNSDLRHKCYLCHDPLKKRKLPILTLLDRKILHFCHVCDREFCHAHRGYVDHSKGLSCPAIDGSCVCKPCKQERE